MVVGGAKNTLYQVFREKRALNVFVVSSIGFCADHLRKTSRNQSTRDFSENRLATIILIRRYVERVIKTSRSYSAEPFNVHVLVYKKKTSEKFYSILVQGLAGQGSHRLSLSKKSKCFKSNSE